jgi:hypothetical protein
MLTLADLLLIAYLETPRTGDQIIKRYRLSEASFFRWTRNLMEGNYISRPKKHLYVSNLRTYRFTLGDEVREEATFKTAFPADYRGNITATSRIPRELDAEIADNTQ